jgi:hypothetical protein
VISSLQNFPSKFYTYILLISPMRATWPIPSYSPYVSKLWGPPSFLSNEYPMGTRGSFPGGKAAGAWSWPLPFFYCRSQECVALYLHPQYFFMVWFLDNHRDKITVIRRLQKHWWWLGWTWAQPTEIFPFWKWVQNTKPSNWVHQTFNHLWSMYFKM